MDNARDTGIVALALVLLVCLTIFFLQVAQPTGVLVDFLFPRI
jgi:uncharacterized membrane protein YGL010W